MAVAQTGQAGTTAAGTGAVERGRQQVNARPLVPASTAVAGLATPWFTLLRVVQGLVMARLAYVLAFHGGWDAFGNASGLIPTVVQGPVGDWLTAIYGNPIALWLIILGASAVAISLLAGFLVRLGSAIAILMTLSFYLASLPPVDGWINLRLVYLIGLLLLMVGQGGHYWGVDSRLASAYERWPWLRWIAG